MNGSTTAAGGHRTAQRAYAVLVGLASLAVLLQGLWAGLFLEHDNRDVAENWINVHATGGEVAIALAALATVVALARLRSRRDLWLGAGALTVLLAVEAWLGGQIHDAGRDTLTAVHVPLAMALMALAVWLPLRVSRGPRRAGGADQPGADPSGAAWATRAPAEGRAAAQRRATPPGANG